MIRGSTSIYVIFGDPLSKTRAPAFFNCYFEQTGADAVFVPLTIARDYSSFARQLFKSSNVAGAIVTLPHKRTLDVLDDCSARVRVAQACNIIARKADGSLYGDIVDGIGFARGLERAGFRFANAKCLLLGSGGAGSAIAAALIEEGVAYLGITNRNADSAAALVNRLRLHADRRDVRIEIVPNDPRGYDLIVNATPLGMKEGDPMPVDVTRLSAGVTVADIVVGDATPLMRAASARGCKTPPSAQMLVEQAPAALELWGFGSVSREQVRSVADSLGWTT